MKVDIVERINNGVLFGDLKPGDTFMSVCRARPDVLLKLDVAQADDDSKGPNVVRLNTAKTEYYKDSYRVWKVLPDTISPAGTILFKKVEKGCES